MEIEAPSKNLPLLWKVYDHIVAHPEEWYQGNWAVQVEDSMCGTAFCFAGHAVMMSHPDAEPVWEEGSAEEVTLDDGRREGIMELAADDLGLDEIDAESLFCGTNSLDRIHTLIVDWESDDQAAWLAEHTS